MAKQYRIYQIDAFTKEKLKGKIVIISLSGRGDKDMMQAKSLLNFDQ